MKEEENVVEQTTRTEEVVDNNADYIAAIKELKQNSVDRSEYDTLKADNKRLLDALVNGQELSQEETKKPVDINKLRQDTFYNDQQDDVTYISNVLTLRKALIEKGEPDPFVPNGQKIAPTDADIAAANRVADALQEMVDTADGNNTVFLNEYQRRVTDTVIPNIRKK